MRFSQLALILGCTAVAFGSIVPLRAEATNYQIKSGVTSVYHDLSYLSSIGLNLTGSDNTVEPINSDFIVGFGIDPTTNFTFSDTGGFIPLSGTIKHTGTVTFNNQTTVGNFSISFDSTRAINNASGLYLKDTYSLNTILFDLSAPENVTLNNNNLTINKVNLLFSPEFAKIIGNSSLAGNLAGIARIDAKVVPVNAVPEPTSTLAFLTVGLGLLLVKIKKQI
ncbi:PEP-CTERM sorting domain-containing protein [Nostocaceae cyanobacterium CENA369]|uniref:PEP-CTERM sorting domain-containing protein n=1 Tax=Dendronalium phyllosphericum CENA369 TaxID=1725256 RepID=A0A8J7LFD2_9NOST|nr:PEP-CTERM sorting domain-containing protein [Dendronalium phyllosphericum]MBH8575066.1 PEP-CTERM sorting domain-containing protein [Dendronalium phyllosphericum CENA369]